MNFKYAVVDKGRVHLMERWATATRVAHQFLNSRIYNVVIAKEEQFAELKAVIIEKEGIVIIGRTTKSNMDLEFDIGKHYSSTAKVGKEVIVYEKG